MEKFLLVFVRYFQYIFYLCSACLKLYSIGDEIHSIGDEIHSIGDEIHSIGDEIDSIGDEIHSIGDGITTSHRNEINNL